MTVLHATSRAMAPVCLPVSKSVDRGLVIAAASYFIAKNQLALRIPHTSKQLQHGV